MRGTWAKPKYLIQTAYTGGEYDVMNTFVRNSVYCSFGMCTVPISGKHFTMAHMTAN